MIKSEKNEEILKQQISLLIIREIGKKMDFSTNETLVNGILECLNSKNESIKNSGSLALGGICLVSFKKINCFQKKYFKKREISKYSFQRS